MRTIYIWKCVEYSFYFLNENEVNNTKHSLNWKRIPIHSALSWVSIRWQRENYPLCSTMVRTKISGGSYKKSGILSWVLHSLAWPSKASCKIWTKQLSLFKYCFLISEGGKELWMSATVRHFAQGKKSLILYTLLTDYSLVPYGKITW